MTGARIATTLINSLRWHDKEFGLETMCVGVSPEVLEEAATLAKRTPTAERRAGEDDHDRDEWGYQQLEKMDELVPLVADADTVYVLLEQELQRRSKGAPTCGSHRGALRCASSPDRS